MRRLATALLLLIAGCSSSGSGSGSGAAATSTAAASPARSAASTAASAASTAAATTALAPTGGASDSSVDARLLAFSLAAQAMAPCESSSDAPACKDRKNLAWLTENVDWELYHAADLVLDIAFGDGSPAANQAVAQVAMNGIEKWQELVAGTSGFFGGAMGEGGKPCKIAPADEEDRKVAKKWLDVKAQQAGVSSSITEKLDRILARRSAYQKIHTLLCSDKHVVVAIEEGGKGRVLPMVN